eukprot:TRINITY_DN347_c1_g3_i1.p1 TRINITY_DN347_c1_g3~~TRINITY_DN347_c1_g3_i1.p1  ORF type:complete len:924 (-),score=289.13 TRINITY_DN347_c1_g3_i1:82-2763(-)
MDSSSKKKKKGKGRRSLEGVLSPSPSPFTPDSPTGSLTTTLRPKSSSSKKKQLKSTSSSRVQRTMRSSPHSFIVELSARALSSDAKDVHPVDYIEKHPRFEERVVCIGEESLFRPFVILDGVNCLRKISKEGNSAVGMREGDDECLSKAEVGEFVIVRIGEHIGKNYVVLDPNFAASNGFCDGDEVEFIDFSGFETEGIDSFDLILEGIATEKKIFMDDEAKDEEDVQNMREICDQFAKDDLFKEAIRCEIDKVLDGFPIPLEGVRLQLLLFGIDWKIYVKPIAKTKGTTTSARMMMTMSPLSSMNILSGIDGEEMYAIECDRNRIGAAGDVMRSSTALPSSALHFRDIGGLEKEKNIILSTLRRSLFGRSDFVEKHGVIPPQGILIHGPHGTGKTMLGIAALHEIEESGASHIRTKRVVASSLISPYIGESESKLKEAFSSLIDGNDSESKGVVFIDEVEVIACNRHRSDASLSNNRLLGTLISLLDSSVVMSGRIFVIASTNEIDALDPSIRRPGRFDVEVEIDVPTEEQREKILATIWDASSSALLEYASSITHGFVGADLHSFVRELSSSLLRRDDEVSDEAVMKELIAEARSRIRPTSLREMVLEVPKVRWDEVGGQEEIKQSLQEAVEWPLSHPEVFKRFNMRPPRGILLYGPPGCSKTLLAKALATESHLNFLAVKGPELLRKYVGESERAVRDVFKKARSAAPAIIFFDEIDALGSRRGGDGGSDVSDRVLSQLLAEMDGLHRLKDVVILGATNRPDVLDEALLRPGRFDRLIYVPLPACDTRESIFGICARRMPFDGDVVLHHLAEITDGYSGAEIVSLCREAAMEALEESLYAEKITWKHFEIALRRVKPRTSKDMILFFERFTKKTSTGNRGGVTGGGGGGG